MQPLNIKAFSYTNNEKEIKKNLPYHSYENIK